MKQEELNKLRNDFMHLVSGGSVTANYDMLSILCECMFQIINVHGKEIPKTKAEAEAKLVLQMMFSKLLTLRNMLNGISYQSRDGLKLNNIVDPTVVAVLVRTLYETVTMFNLVYLIPQSEEEKKIMYNLWVIAGLKYRQRFSANATTVENKKKQADEAAKIAEMIKEVEETEAYKALKETAKRKVQDQLKRKDYKMVIDHDDVNLLSWDGVMPYMGMDTDKMGVMYTYFSLYAHPSNVAVFQYGDLFEITKDDYTQMSNFNVATGVKLVSFFLADYLRLFPEAKAIFEKLPLIDQIVINYHSKFIRKDGGVINDSLKSLG